VLNDVAEKLTTLSIFKYNTKRISTFPNFVSFDYVRVIGFVNNSKLIAEHINPTARQLLYALYCVKLLSAVLSSYEDLTVISTSNRLSYRVFSPHIPDLFGNVGSWKFVT
jgi:hypothetical protein